VGGTALVLRSLLETGKIEARADLFAAEDPDERHFYPRRVRSELLRFGGLERRDAHEHRRNDLSGNGGHDLDLRGGGGLCVHDGLVG